MNTEEKLNMLYGYKQLLHKAQSAKQELIDSVTPQEVKDKIADIEVEFVKNNLELAEKTEALEEEIRNEVIGIGSTVKGKYYMAVYANGRVTWDNKGLQAYAEWHPEVDKYKKVGEPSVSIREIK